MAQTQTLIDSERLAMLSRLVGGASHELNNLLTGIIGYTQLLREVELAEAVRGDIELIENQAYRARLILKHLQPFIRKQEPERIPVDINDLVLRVLDLRAYQLRASGIPVTTDLGLHLPILLADPYEMQFALLTMILNVEHIIGQWGQLQAQPRPKPYIHIETVLQQAANGPPSLGVRVLAVGVNERGIEGQQWRIEQGMVMLQSVAHEYAGTVDVLPGLDASIILQLTLPVSSQRSYSAQLKQIPEALEAASARVLVVDDEASIIVMMRRMLERTGLEVDLARTGNEALEQLQANQYQLVISDLQLPDLAGEQLYARLLQIQPELARRVVFLTAGAAGEQFQMLRRQFQGHLLAKPFDLYQLLGLIERILASEQRGQVVA